MVPVRLEGAHATGRQFVESDPERINVAALVEQFGGGLFRRHVRGCARDKAGLRAFDGVQQPGEAEVHQVEVAALVDHHVSGLQVAVQHLLVVCGGQCLGDGNAGAGREAVTVGAVILQRAGRRLLAGGRRRSRSRRRTKRGLRRRVVLRDGRLQRRGRRRSGRCLHHQARERHAAHQLHREEKRVIAAAAGREDADDARVIEARQGVGLAPEALDRLGLRGQPRGQHLQRDPARGVPLLRFVDLAHAALAERTDDLEVAEALTCVEQRTISTGPRAATGSRAGGEPCRMCRAIVVASKRELQEESLTACCNIDHSIPFR